MQPAQFPQSLNNMLSETFYAMNLIPPLSLQFEKVPCSQMMLCWSKSQGAQPDPTSEGPISPLYESYPFFQTAWTNTTFDTGRFTCSYSIHCIIGYVIIIAKIPRSLRTNISTCHNVCIECRSLGRACVPASMCTDFPLVLIQHINPFFIIFFVIIILHL